MDRKSQEILARLRAQIAISDAKVNANPKPYLEEANRRLCEVLEVLEKVKYSLSPDYVFDVWDQQCNKQAITQPGDIQGEAYIRCNKALEVIRRFEER